MKKSLMVSLLAFCLLSSGCGGGNSSSDPSPAAWPISGNWQMTLKKSNTLTRTQSGFLLENSNAVSGALIFSGSPCAGLGTATGTVRGRDVSLLVEPTGLSIDLTGILGTDKSSMSGTYMTLASGCGEPETGTWTGNLVAPLNGSFQGSFVSTRSGANFPISAALTQGPNGGTASTSLTGTLNIMGSSCFTTANISGLISGTSVVINFGDSSGTPVGQLTATSTLDGTSLSGAYSIPTQGAPGAPCHAGDVGTFTLAL
jgi:hypothetical protein